jgi:hypothetical protein
MPTKLTPEILTAALAGYEEQKKRIDAQIAGLRQILDGGSTDGAAPEGRTEILDYEGRRSLPSLRHSEWGVKS